MIAPMKKVLILSLESLKKTMLDELGSLGLLHLQTMRRHSNGIARAEEKKAQLSEAVAALASLESSVDKHMRISEREAFEVADTVTEYLSRLRELNERQRVLLDEFEQLSPWGDFDFNSLELLRQEGWDYRFYHLPPKVCFPEHERIKSFLIKKDKTAQYVIAFAHAQNEDNFLGIPFVGFDLKRSLVMVRSELAEVKKAQDDYSVRLRDSKQYLESLREALRFVQSEIDYEKALTDVEVHEDCVYIVGFLPEEKLDIFKNFAKTASWAYLIEDPKSQDNVPTLLKYNFFTRLLRPIFTILETYPGYQERDISFFFLLFFSVFFAMIIGDAAYGLLFLLTGFGFGLSGYLRHKQWSDASLLTMLLGLTTTIWGALSGNWFGSALATRFEFLSSLMLPALASTNPGSTKLVITLCFFLGFTHLLIAHSWNFLRALVRRPFIRSFAELGQLALIYGVFNVVLSLVVDSSIYPLHNYYFYSVGLGLLLILLFSQQDHEGFIKGLVAGLANAMQIVLGAVSVFSDIVSYIRLFAVGIASLAIADSFNGLALGIFEGGSWWLYPLAALIILLGHVMNLVMGLLGVIVHGVRLNLLEFSMHLGQEWSGQVYKPFRIFHRGKKII